MMVLAIATLQWQQSDIATGCKHLNHIMHSEPGRVLGMNLNTRPEMTSMKNVLASNK